MRVEVLSERPMGDKVKSYLVKQGEELVTEKPDIIVVAYYPWILKKEEYEDVPLGAINLHPGFLPYNRGMYPHIWPLFDKTPCGVTIHYIDEGIDTGDIIAQKEIEVLPTDTAGSLEVKTQQEIFKLFKKIWPKIRFGKAPRMPQVGKGTFHSAKDISALQGEFDRDIIDCLRACTFKDRSYGYFMHEGKKVYVGVKFYE